MKPSKILILTDLSELSKSLIQYGLDLAKCYQAQPFILYCYFIPPNVAGEFFIPADAFDGYDQKINEEFDTLREKIPDLRETDTKFYTRFGELVPEMNQLIDQEGIDLVLVGNRGKGLWTNILGSNTVKVIQQAHCPVLAVPDYTLFQPFSKPAMAIDLKETKVEVLRWIADFVKWTDGKVDVVHVQQAPVPIDSDHLINTLERIMEDVPHHFFHIHSLDVEEAIETHLEGNNNDLLVMLPKAHDFFDRLFQKSITRQMTFQEKIPLLAIHA